MFEVKIVKREKDQSGDILRSNNKVEKYVMFNLDYNDDDDNPRVFNKTQDEKMGSIFVSIIPNKIGGFEVKIYHKILEKLLTIESEKDIKSYIDKGDCNLVKTENLGDIEIAFRLKTSKGNSILRLLYIVDKKNKNNNNKNKNNNNNNTNDDSDSDSEYKELPIYFRKKIIYNNFTCENLVTEDYKTEHTTENYASFEVFESKYDIFKVYEGEKFSRKDKISEGIDYLFLTIIKSENGIKIYKSETETYDISANYNELTLIDETKKDDITVNFEHFNKSFSFKLSYSDAK